MTIHPPTFELLQGILQPGGGQLFICAPFMSSTALERVRRKLDSHGWQNFTALEIWIFLNIDAHRAGVMNYLALQEFVAHASNTQSIGIAASLFHHANLHAKVYRSDHGALVTSANLTSQAFQKNVESCVFFSKSELGLVDKWIEKTREQMMKRLTRRKFNEFVGSLPDVDRRKASASKAAVLQELVGKQEVPPHVRFPLR
jgi:phosphatidylserine/phosphatidylglycerophosphate/cardiolipin synthase-like enzyme